MGRTDDAVIETPPPLSKRQSDPVIDSPQPAVPLDPIKAGQDAKDSFELAGKLGIDLTQPKTAISIDDMKGLYEKLVKGQTLSGNPNLAVPLQGPYLHGGGDFVDLPDVEAKKEHQAQAELAWKIHRLAWLGNGVKNPIAEGAKYFDRHSISYQAKSLMAITDNPGEHQEQTSASVQERIDALMKSPNLADRFIASGAKPYANMLKTGEIPPSNFAWEYFKQAMKHGFANFAEKAAEMTSGDFTGIGGRQTPELWGTAPIPVTPGQQTYANIGGAIGQLPSFLVELGLMKRLGLRGEFARTSWINTAGKIETGLRGIAATEQNILAMAAATNLEGGNAAQGGLVGAAFEAGKLGRLVPGPAWVKAAATVALESLAGYGTVKATGGPDETAYMFGLLPIAARLPGGALKVAKGFASRFRPDMPPEAVAELAGKIESAIPEAAKSETAKPTKNFLKEYGMTEEQAAKEFGVTPEEFKIAFAPTEKPAEKPGETTPKPGTPEEAVYVKNAYTEKRRAELGLSERVTPETKADETTIANAAAEWERNPTAARELQTKIESNPATTLSDEQVALLGMRGVQLENQYDMAYQKYKAVEGTGDVAAIAEAKGARDKAKTELDSLYTAWETAGTQQGRSLRFRGVGLNRDYSLGKVQRNFEVTNGRPASEKEVAKFEKLTTQLADMQKRADELSKQNDASQQQTESQKSIIEALQKKLDEGIVAGAKTPRPDRAIKVSTRDPNSPKFGTTNRFFKKVDWKDADLLAGEILPGARAFSKLVETLGYYVEGGIRTIPELVKLVAENAPHLAKRAEEAATLAMAQFKRFKAADRLAENIPAGDTKAMTRDMGQIAKSLIAEEGIKDRQTLLKRLTEEVQKIDPSLAPDDIAKIYSGYGQRSMPPQGEVEKTAAQLRQEIQIEVGVRDAQSGKPVEKSGRQPQEMTDEARRLIQQRQEELRKPGYVATDPKTQMKSALDEAKRTVSNRIADLEEQIDKGERTVANKTEIIPDAELETLRAERDALQEQLDILVPRKQTPLTDEQKIERATVATQRSLDELNRRIKEGDLYAKEHPEGPTNPELEKLRAERDAKAEELAAIRKFANAKSPAEIAARAEQIKLNAATKAVERQIAELDRRVKEGDLEPKAKKEGPTSPELEALRSRRDALQEQLQELRDIANPKATPEERAIQQSIARKKAKLAVLDQQQTEIDAGTYTEPTKPAKRTPAEAEMILQAKINQKKWEIDQKTKTPTERAWDMINGIGAALKTPAGGDESLGFRQLWALAMHDVGNLVTMRPTATWAKAQWAQTKVFFALKRMAAMDKTLTKSPWYNFATTKEYKLMERIDELAGIMDRPESGISAWAQKWIPLIRRGNAAAKMANNTAVIRALEELGPRFQERGLLATDAGKRQLAKLVGDLVGRSLIPKGNTAATLFKIGNTFFFSPRAWKSRMANVGTLFHTLSTNPAMRAEGIRTLVGYGIVTTTAALIAKGLGADVDTDWESPSFLKASFGNTHVDLLGPYGSTIRFIIQVGLSEVEQIKDEPHRDRARIIRNYVSNQSAPFVGTIWSATTGKDFLDREIIWSKEWPQKIRDATMYMWANDAIDAFIDEYQTSGISKALPKSAAAGTASWLGIGIQTYDDEK